MKWTYGSMSHENPAQLPTTHPQVLELCIVLGKCLRGIALVTHPPTSITITTQPINIGILYCIMKWTYGSMSHKNPAQLLTIHPQVLELCIILGKCLRGIAFVTHPLTPITITTKPH